MIRAVLDLQAFDQHFEKTRSSLVATQKNRGRKKKIFFRPLFFVDANLSATEVTIIRSDPRPSARAAAPVYLSLTGASCLSSMLLLVSVVDMTRCRLAMAML